MMNSSSLRSLAAALSILLCAPHAGRAQETANPFEKIGHIVVIFTENRSFDNVFGLFPGADGLALGANRFVQIDFDGSPLSKLPRVRFEKHVDERFPESLPNAPFAIEAFVPNSGKTGDLTHDFYQEQEQINGGKMDRFAAVSNAGGLVMGYYDGRNLHQWRLAQEFTLADHFFHAAFGGSFVNHFFLICACPPVFPSAPQKLIPELDERTGFLARDENSPTSALDGPPRWRKPGKVTPDGFVTGTLQPTHPISPLDVADPETALPPQTAPTIGDRLSEKGVSWAWYAGGWKDMLQGRIKQREAPDYFQNHHQPFAYFAAYVPGTEGRAHLKDAAEFFDAASAGALPAVSFYKPVGKYNQHPFYADLKSGDEHVADVVARLRESPNWKDMLIIVAADENGGAWDHVAPPQVDRFGPGARVPALIISPFAKKGFVDHTIYDTTSILKTIETRFGLAPLTTRDAKAHDLRNALEPEPRPQVESAAK